jgi:hypothetical protein
VIKPRYSFDTNAFIDWWVRYYSPAILPSLKTHVEGVVAEGRLKASRYVLTELEQGGDDLYKWAKANKNDIFLEDDEQIQRLARPLISQYSYPSQPRRGLGGADPFVIARAQATNPSWIVVSGEKGDINNPKIDFVCKQNGITCMSFRQFWQNEGWVL